jgi:EmrB/QacA subfamily drug resistance transporter
VALGEGEFAFLPVSRCRDFASMTDTASKSRLVALVVAAALFMEMLDGTIIAVALPAMAVSLGTDPVTLTIGITSYLLTLVVVIPASGWLADRYGVRTIFATAIAGFTLASLACGLSETLWQFTAARIVQGASAALMSPVGRLAVLRNTEKKDLVRAIAFITWPALVAPVVGPPLGGLISETLSWRFIFFVNLPLGLAGILLVLRFVPNHKASGQRPFDVTGFVLTALALASLIAGLDLATHTALHPAISAVLFVGGLGLGVLAVRHIAARSDRLVDLATLRVTTFAAATLHGGFLFRITAGAVPYLLPLYFQIGFGLDAFTAGLMVLAYAFGNVAMKTVTTPVLRRFGFRRVLVVNGLLAALAILACAALTPGTPEAVSVLVLFAAGCFRSMQFTSQNTLMFADIPDSLKSSATTLSVMIHQLGVGVGVALAAMTLNASAALRDGAGPGPDSVDFRVALAVMAAIAFVSMWRFVFLDRAAGAEVSGHRAEGHNPVKKSRSDS